MYYLNSSRLGLRQAISLFLTYLSDEYNTNKLTKQKVFSSDMKYSGQYVYQLVLCQFYNLSLKFISSNA